MSMKTDAPATRKDVEEVVSRLVGESLGEALQLISERFDKVDQKFAEVDKRFDKQDKKIDKLQSDVTELKRRTTKLEKITGRIESRFNVITVRGDDHDFRLHMLEQTAVAST